MQGPLKCACNALVDPVAIARRCCNMLVRKVLEVSPTYFLLHWRHSITYTTEEEEQLRREVMGNCSGEVESSYVLVAVTKGHTPHRAFPQGVMPVVHSWNWPVLRSTLLLAVRMAEREKPCRRQTGMTVESAF